MMMYDVIFTQKLTAVIRTLVKMANVYLYLVVDTDVLVTEATRDVTVIMVSTTRCHH